MSGDAMIHVVLSCGCSFYRSPKGFVGEVEVGHSIWCHDHPHDADSFDASDPASCPEVLVISITECPTVADLVGSDPDFAGARTAAAYVRDLRG